MKLLNQRLLKHIVENLKSTASHEIDIARPFN